MKQEQTPTNLPEPQSPLHEMEFRYPPEQKAALAQQGVNASRRECLVTVGRVIAGVASLAPVAALLGGYQAEAKGAASQEGGAKAALPSAVSVAPTSPSPKPQSFAESLQLISRDQLKLLADPSRIYTEVEVSFSVDTSRQSGAWRPANRDTDATSILVMLPKNDLPATGEYAVNTQYLHSAEILVRKTPGADFMPVSGEVIEGTNKNFATRIMVNKSEMEGMEFKLNLVMTLSNIDLRKAAPEHNRDSIRSTFSVEYDDFYNGTGAVGYFFKDKAVRDSYLALAAGRGLIIDQWPANTMTADEKILTLIGKIDQFTEYVDKVPYEPCHTLQTGRGNCSDLSRMMQALCALNKIPYRSESGRLAETDSNFGKFETYGAHGWSVIGLDRGPARVDLTIKGNPIDPSHVCYAATRKEEVSFHIDGFKTPRSGEQDAFLVSVPPARFPGFVSALIPTNSSYRKIGRY